MRRNWFVVFVAVTLAFSMNAQVRQDREDVAQRVADRIFLGPRIDLPDGIKPFKIEEDATTTGGRRRAVRHLSPDTPRTAIVFFRDWRGDNAGFVASFPVPAGVVMSHYRIALIGSTEVRIEIPPKTIVTADNANSGWQGFMWGGYYNEPSPPLPPDTVAFEVEYTGTLNFVVRHDIAPGSGPLADAVVYPDGRIFLTYKPGYFMYPPAAFVWGKNVPVQAGSWITPPSEEEFHTNNAPVTSCVGFARIECSTLLRDIPPLPGN